MAVNSSKIITEAYNSISAATASVKKLAETPLKNFETSRLTTDVFEQIGRTKDKTGSLFGVWEMLASDFGQNTGDFLRKLRSNHPRVYSAIQADEMIKTLDIKI